jgi:hypothetical protein
VTLLTPAALHQLCPALMDTCIVVSKRVNRWVMTTAAPPPAQAECLHGMQCVSRLHMPGDRCEKAHLRWYDTIDASGWLMPTNAVRLGRRGQRATLPPARAHAVAL